MNGSASTPGPFQHRFNPLVLGVACCVISAIGYAAVHIGQRFLTVHCDRVWVVFIKEAVTVAVLGPWLLWRAWRGQRILPAPLLLFGLILMGLATQLLGNLPAIWALSVVGLAVTVPAISGMTVVAGALLGRTVLGERISLRQAGAMGLLIASILVLSTSGQEVNDTIASSAPVATGPLWVALAIGAACMAGLVYGLLSVVIRHSVTASASPTVLVTIITGMGVVSLGPIGLGCRGLASLAEIPAGDLAIILAVGLCNLIAFLAITKGLQLTSVVHANVLSASQTAMAVVAGFLFFGEPPSLALLLGVGLTIAGTMLIHRGHGEELMAEV